MAKSASKKQSNKKNNSKEDTDILRQIFITCGFTHIESDGIEFSFNGIKSDIDDIFIYENLIVLCEKTKINDIAKHFPVKQRFHHQIHSDIEKFIDEYRSELVNNNFNEALSKTKFKNDEFLIKSLYFSEESDFNDSTINQPDPFILMKPSVGRYLLELSSIINYSAKYEILKFLSVKLSQLGQDSLGGKKSKNEDYDAFLLPHKHSNYPKDFAIVSFYIDADALLKRAYVLRRNGWENAHLSYQRFIDKNKIQSMRTYLSAPNGRVFVNNLIITLPNSTLIKDSKSNPINNLQIKDLETVTLSLPYELATIGIIDGQHRVFSYHEGNDANENLIQEARVRQNLLATGIIFPKNYSEAERIKFEADLFLKINSTQSPVNDFLKQELETIINPFSDISIAKSIVDKLSEQSPLKEHIQSSIYDSPEKVKTASLIRYSLKPIVTEKPKGTLYSIWNNSSKDLKESATREEYINFCKNLLCKLLVALKTELSQSNQWHSVGNKLHPGVLSPTSIGGFFLYFKHILKNNLDPSTIDYQATFKGLDATIFKKYTSSSWAKVANELYQAHPPKQAGSN